MNAQQKRLEKEEKAAIARADKQATYQFVTNLVSAINPIGMVNAIKGQPQQPAPPQQQAAAQQQPQVVYVQQSQPASAQPAQDDESKDDNKEQAQPQAQPQAQAQQQQQQPQSSDPNDLAMQLSQQKFEVESAQIQ